MIRPLRTYLTGSIEELRRVVWPTPREVLRTTLWISLGVILMIVFLGLLDTGLTVFLRDVILNQ